MLASNYHSRARARGRRGANGSQSGSIGRGAAEPPTPFHARGARTGPKAIKAIKVDSVAFNESHRGKSKASREIRTWPWCTACGSAWAAVEGRQDKDESRVSRRTLDTETREATREKRRDREFIGLYYAEGRPTCVKFLAANEVMNVVRARRVWQHCQRGIAITPRIQK